MLQCFGGIEDLEAAQSALEITLRTGELIIGSSIEVTAVADSTLFVMMDAVGDAILAIFATALDTLRVRRKRSDP